MTIEQQVLQKLRDLTPDKQKEVLNFVDSLAAQNRTTQKAAQSGRTTRGPQY